jgi:hypothetical protein
MKNFYPSKIQSAGKSFLCAFVILLIGGFVVYALIYRSEIENAHEVQQRLTLIKWTIIGFVIFSSIVFIKGCIDLIGSAKD